MRIEYNKNKIKEYWLSKESSKESYKLLGELLNRYITEIGDSIDKSSIIDEPSQLNKELSIENKLLQNINKNLNTNNSKLENELKK